MLSNCDVGEDTWVPWTAKRSNQSILNIERKEVLNIHWKDCCWSWSSNPLDTWCEELTQWRRAWCWERLRAGGEGGNRGWNGWMASSTQWTWVWANSGRQAWTGRPVMLQSMGLQSVGHGWATKKTIAKVYCTPNNKHLMPFLLNSLSYWCFRKK